MISPSKKINALNKVYDEAIGKNQNASPTWKWIAGKLNETRSPINDPGFQSSPEPIKPKIPIIDRVIVKEIACGAHAIQKKAEKTDKDDLFDNALGKENLDEDDYNKAMQEIWGGGGEATGLEKQQYQDELFEKAA